MPNNQTNEDSKLIDRDREVDEILEESKYLLDQEKMELTAQKYRAKQPVAEIFSNADKKPRLENSNPLDVDKEQTVNENEISGDKTATTLQAELVLEGTDDDYPSPQNEILKETEKEALFARIRQGDQEAREMYIKGNLRLVLSVIKRFSGSHENLDDLFQIGCIGLIKSIDNFNPDLQVKFSTYAVPMIIGEIRRYLRDNNSIRVSRSLRDTAYKAIHAKEVLSRNSFKEPTLQEIAEESGVAAEDILYALDAIQSPVSLYDPVYTDGGDTLYVMDQISDKKNKEENWVEKLSLSEAMNHLSERENFIINLRFFEGKTQMEVADEIHISQAQVSRLEKSALKTIRQYLTL